MTKQASIAYISGLMDNPATLTSGDQGSIGSFRQSFPYFVPARYLEALDKHREQPFNSAMLSSVAPYIGDWMMFCDFMHAGAGGLQLAATGHEADLPVAESIPVLAEPVVEAPLIKDVESHPVEMPNEQLPDILDEAPIPEVLEAVTPEGENVVEDIINEIPQPISTEELENRHNSFWIQGEDQETGGIVQEAGAENNEQESGVDSRIQEPEAVADGSVIEQVHEEVEETPVTEMEEYVDVEEVEVTEIPQYDHKREKPLIYPVYTDDYFLQQGEKVPNELPEEIESLKQEEGPDDAAKALMVMMSFSEWLLHFKSTTEKQKEESKDQRALKTMWQKEKLAAAIEEENEEIPENVFEMAVNSITKEDGLASESLAEIYIKQGKYDKAIDMYRKLSLRNPQKNAYFARKIEEILKEKQS